MSRLVDLFKTIAEKYPHQSAIRYPDGSTYTYKDLYSHATTFAAAYTEAGLQTSDVVVLPGDKSFDMFASFIGALLAGVSYSLYDPDSPLPRMQSILATAQPRICVIDPTSQTLQDIQTTASRKVCTFKELRDSPRTTYTERDIPEDTCAYIMFTSGSTGEPKGAGMSHSNIMGLINWAQTTFTFGPGEVLTNVNPSYFDNSVFDMYATFFTGATLVPFSRAEITSPLEFITQLEKTKCTSWFSVPTTLKYLLTMRAFTPETMKTIRRFIFGGEGFAKEELKKIVDIYAPHKEFFNVYGPTECTCICSCHKITEKDFEDMNGFPQLGHLIPGFKGIVLNSNLAEVPDGEPGELCLAGPGVGMGYINNSAKTAQAFIPSPHDNTTTLYRTGDIVTRNPQDGTFTIAGRIDNQIKHLGYRIELEEIDCALSKINYLAQSMTVYLPGTTVSHLVAVIVPHGEITTSQLSKDLQQYLPYYMIPDKYYILDSLPVNANGKTDRKELTRLTKEYFT